MTKIVYRHMAVYDFFSMTLLFKAFGSFDEHRLHQHHIEGGSRADT